MATRSTIGIFGCVSLLAGCGTIKTESVVRVEPVHITVDVNVNVKVDKALDDFFGDLDKKSATIAAPATP